MTEIPKPGATEPVRPSADSRFMFGGLPWLPMIRPPLFAPETVQSETEQPGANQTPLEDAERFKRDLLAAQLIGEMGSIVSLPPRSAGENFSNRRFSKTGASRNP